LINEIYERIIGDIVVDEIVVYWWDGYIWLGKRG
jgi:hypothetical protein